jgi:nicotinate phosphoribosyltransferase
MSLALFTDLYELTMMAGYYTAGLEAPATFELYVRALPPRRSFLVAAGLEQALAYLEELRFTADDIAHLRRLPALRRVRREFFDEYLAGFRFTGDVWAAPEGTPIFPPAPLLRVTAPLPEAQLVETALLALVGFQTSVASRAARMVRAAEWRRVVEFGARRSHGVEAGVLAARAAFIAGCESTSNVEAGRRFGIPVSGTMAHAWVTAFPDEQQAFRQFVRIFGDHTVLLLDTYDTLAAARAVAASGLTPAAVRLDSGNLAALSRDVREILDAAGLRATKIFVSGDLDERRIASIVESGAPVDGFGVGAALSTASDAPSLGAVYKLVEVERGGTAVPVKKHSPGKETAPGRKQVWRVVAGGRAVEDVIELADAPPPAAGATAEPLLTRVMRAGRREEPPLPAAELRARCLAAIERLPPEVRRLEGRSRYPVRIGPALQRAQSSWRLRKY